MVTTASAAAVVDLCAAFIALHILSFLDPQLGAAYPPPAQATLLDSAPVELLQPLAALGALATAAAAIYRHLQQHSAAAAAGAAGNCRLYQLFAIVCASVGTLEFSFFVHPAGPFGGGGDAAVQARALGLAAARVLPAAAAVTFFLGMALIIVAHIRAGGEGGGGALGAMSFLTQTAFAAAAFLICLTALALYGIY